MYSYYYITLYIWLKDRRDDDKRFVSVKFGFMNKRPFSRFMPV